MNVRKYLYVGGTVCGTVLAFVLATGVWQPLAKADGNSRARASLSIRSGPSRYPRPWAPTVWRTLG